MSKWIELPLMMGYVFFVNYFVEHAFSTSKGIAFSISWAELIVVGSGAVIFTAIDYLNREK